MSSDARSLFLPLADTESAIHCGFYTSFGDQPLERVLTALDVFNDNVTRQNYAAVMYRDQSVGLWNLKDEETGPRLLKKLSPKTAAPAKTEATVATMFSLDLLFSVVGQSYSGNSVSTLLRGAVGNSAGRVSFFSETQMLDGFQAHDCPVRQVEGLLIGESTGSPLRARLSGSITYGATMHPSATSLASVDTARSFPPMLGFATMGENGIVFVWRRQNGEFVKSILLEPSFTSKCPVLTVALPLREGSIAMSSLERPCSPSEPVAYSPATPNDRETTAEVAYNSSLIFLATNGFSKAIKVCSAEALQEVEPSVELEGTFSRTTAIAADGTVCLAAREKVVYAMDYKARRCNRILTTSSCVTTLVFRQPIAIVGCENGKIYTVNVQTGGVLGVTYTHSSTAVRSMTFLYEAMLLSIVDATGLVEIMELPQVFLREGSEHGTPIQYCSAAIVLKRVMQLEECRSGGGTATLQRALAAEEHLLLARLNVPEDVNRYLGRQHIIL